MALEIICVGYMSMLAYLEDQGADLSEEDRQRRDRRVPRIAIRRYSESPFAYLYRSGNDQALLNCCAVDHVAFRELLALFKPVYDNWTVDRTTGQIREVTFTRDGKAKGRQREIDAIGALGLVLYWYRTRGSVARSIALAFGLTASPMYVWLKFARRVLLFVLQDHPKAKVCSPCNYEVEDYIAAIARAYPLAGQARVWGAIDGLKLHLEKSTNHVEQNKYYNGWVHGTYISNVFLFAPDGRIRLCTINAPGSWHDSTQANYGLYSRMHEVFRRTGGRVVVDSAFNSGLKGRKDYLIKSAQTMPIGASRDQLRLNRQATSVRQLSEWGMRMIQAQFPRLKDNIRLEDFGDRRIILNLMVLLYNFQTSRIGINTILNSYMSRTAGFDSYALTCAGDMQLVTETANEVFAVLA